MLASARVRLFEADPDLGSVLTAEELVEAQQLTVPVLAVERACELTQLRQPTAFAALVLEGMVLRQLMIDSQLGMRIHGPGDIVSLRRAPPPMVVADCSLRALPSTRLALLGRELLFAVHRWPSLVVALQLRAAHQADRLAAQLVICQLPRVDQRLLSLLWLLAESWGRVTPAGTSLPLKLTHEALGALVGARRPTVTLALRELSERGALIRQSRGWLLLEPPPVAPQPTETLQAPELIGGRSSRWTKAPAAPIGPAPDDPTAVSAALMDSLARLHAQHARSQEQVTARLRRAAQVRERSRAVRQRVVRDRLTRQSRRSP
jgi:CRP/FNR family cyclic AMP-dependent transcriptional regulator